MKGRPHAFANFKLIDGDRERLERISAAKRDLVVCGEPYALIAERLRVPLGTVKSRTHRARVALLNQRRRDAEATL